MAKWNKILSRGNVHDRRGAPRMIGGAGVVVVAAVMIFNFLQTGDVGSVLSGLQNLAVETSQTANTADFEGADSYEVFAATVLGSNNEMWSKAFAASGLQYREPKLVLFRSATESGCGSASSQDGPHYCPPDETIYLDETFFAELQARFGAQGGDVAEAYVISHEVAHHVQNQLGIMEKVRAGDLDQSINLELQADCFAGLWAYSIKHLEVFEQGEIVEAIDAAAAVGDDRIQKRTTGRVSPESWTHGSSAQRTHWFNEGFEKGSVDACNTF